MAKKSKEKFKIYKNVFDNFTLRTLFKLSGQGHFEDLVSPVEIGKESNIFLAEKGEEYVIVKIYRLENCNFNKMYSYIKSDPRFMDIKNQRRQVIFKWVQREYRNLLMAREKINVPTPMVFENNVLVMESIGGNIPAPQLRNTELEDPVGFSKKVLKSIEGITEMGLIHADLSEFNILVHNDIPYFIDFSQGTSKKDPNAREYLKRDLTNISKYFAKLDIKIEVEKEYKRLVEIFKKGNN